MPFQSGIQSDIQPVGSGERHGNNNIILNASVFEDGLLVGRFAKLDTGSLDNIDASVAPVIAGVVLRDATRSIESGDAIDGSLFKQVQFLRTGLISVEVVPGQTPAMFGPVFVHNLADANAGKASTVDDANTEPSTAEFIREITTDVWLVLVR